MGKVYWSLTAARDLENIGDYISRDSPLYAVAFVERLIHTAESLSQFPERGRIVPEFAREEIRELIFQRYRVVYKMSAGNVFVIAVCHASMDILRKARREEWEL